MKVCIECGCQYDEKCYACPNCGCANSNYSSVQYDKVAAVRVNVEKTDAVGRTVQYAVYKRDWAQYVYDSAALYWDTISKRYCEFSGRASRREFWSFMLIPCLFPFLLLCFYPLLGVIGLVTLIPYIGVWVRRMHDINRSGWWCLCPIVCFFFALKASDKGANNYGAPANYDVLS